MRLGDDPPRRLANRLQRRRRRRDLRVEGVVKAILEDEVLSQRLRQRIDRRAPKEAGRGPNIELVIGDLELGSDDPAGREAQRLDAAPQFDPLTTRQPVAVGPKGVLDPHAEVVEGLIEV